MCKFFATSYQRRANDSSVVVGMSGRVEVGLDGVAHRFGRCLEGRTDEVGLAGVILFCFGHRVHLGRDLLRACGDLTSLVDLVISVLQILGWLIGGNPLKVVNGNAVTRLVFHLWRLDELWTLVAYAVIVGMAAVELDAKLVGRFGGQD